LGFLPPRRVGLLGGSFNPAHEGHRHISEEALKRLRLDQIWWLVSPQNPLKPSAGMAPLASRLAAAKAVARDPRIKVLDLETRLDTRYTIDTLSEIVRLYPKTRFVWIMGADNLKQIRHWRRWRAIFHLLPVAVMDRPTYALTALHELAACHFRRQRVDPRAAFRLTSCRPPAWTFLPIPLDAHSASDIRAQHQKNPLR
jgi:nicotinate-nucleotide adenylyltransferase